MSFMAQPRNRRGFSLIELLVVISLIVLLVSLLMPALRHARRSAWTTACQSNQRQLGIFIHQYTLDERDWLPPIQPQWRSVSDADLWVVQNSGVHTGAWFMYQEMPNGTLRHQLPRWPQRDVLHCPQWGTKWGAFGRRTNYGLNAHTFFWSSGGDKRFLKKRHIRHPSNTVQALDGARDAAWGYQYCAAERHRASPSGHQGQYHHPGDTLNLTLFDGHVRQTQDATAGGVQWTP